MSGKVDAPARIAAICYTLVVAAMVWFTLAWGGINFDWRFDEALVFIAIALSPVPVLVLCFRRYR
jgi:hypothetical protein